MNDLRQAAQAALDALDRPSAHGEFVGWMVGVQQAAADLRAALAEPAETPSTNKELLALIERLQARYGVSFLGSERAMLHFARDWVFLTTPAAPTPKAKPDDALDALRELVALKDMKERLRDLHERGHSTDYEDYYRRKPLAWKRARAVIEGRTTR